jgi:hypothetical protein
VIWLASRVVVGGGRENGVRLALMAIGLVAATVMLLCAVVAMPALQNHDDRRGWTNTSMANREPEQDERTSDSLLWRLVETRFGAGTAGPVRRGQWHGHRNRRRGPGAGPPRHHDRSP